MIDRNIIIACLACLLLAGGVFAQRLVTVDTTAPPNDEYAEVWSISPASPAGGPLFWLPGPAHVPGPPDLGGVTCDNTDGVLYSCDGANVYSRNNPYYWPATPPPPPPPAIPGGLGPITGMAISHGFGGPVRFWWCDNNQIVQADPGGVITYGPFAVGPIAQLRGLDTDPFTGHVWAVGANSVVYEINVGGATGVVVNTFPPTTYAPPPVPATGIALDKSCPNPLQVFVSYPGPGGAGPPAPGAAFEIFTGVAVPLIHAFPNGLTYHAAPVRLPGAGSCGGAPPPLALYNSPMSIGNAGFQLTVPGMGPGLLVISLGHVPGGLTVAGLIGTLYVDLASTYWVFPVAPPFNIPLTTAVVCTTAYAQWAFPCGPQWVLSDALQLDLSAP